MRNHVTQRHSKRHRGRFHLSGPSGLCCHAADCRPWDRARSLTTTGAPHAPHIPVTGSPSTCGYGPAIAAAVTGHLYKVGLMISTHPTMHPPSTSRQRPKRNGLPAPLATLR